MLLMELFSLMCLFTLSSVTGMNAISIYPEKLGQETKYSQFQNGTISPCSRNLVQEVELIIIKKTKKPFSRS